jgi:Neocarzinostatin family
VLAASKSHAGILGGMVDPKEVGAAGHSNGAGTTLALVSNSCCLDPRVRAAVVMAGDPSGFPGHAVYQRAPPILIVHGTADPLIPYSDGVEVFNAARGPKALLSLTDGDHGAAAGASPTSASYVFSATVDFFDAYLKGDAAARRHLADDQKAGVAVMHLGLNPGSRVTVQGPKTPALHLHASVTPEHDLTNGEVVTVSWKGYGPGQTVDILECAKNSPKAAGAVAACTFSNAIVLHPDPTGSGSVFLRIVTGAVGKGTCDASNRCSLVVDNAGSSAPDAAVHLTLTFAR